MHASFLIAAYAVVWVGVVLYVASLGRKSRHLELELDELRQLIERRAK